MTDQGTKEPIITPYLNVVLQSRDVALRRAIEYIGSPRSTAPYQIDLILSAAEVFADYILNGVGGDTVWAAMYGTEEDPSGEAARQAVRDAMAESKPAAPVISLLDRKHDNSKGTSSS